MTDTIMARLLREVRQTPPDTAIETLLLDTEGQMDGLREDLDRLTVQVQKLLAERAETTRVLSDFYNSDISLHSVQPVLELCCRLNPALRGSSVTVRGKP